VFLAQASGDGGSSLAAFLPLLVIVAAFYFLLIRPQRQRAKRQRELLQQLEVGDRVQTVGGLYGVVVGMDEDAVVLGVEDGRIRVARRAVARRMTLDEDK
jgi:preprotein translocase subunit YajC